MRDLKIQMKQSNTCLSHYVVEYKRSDEEAFNLLSPNPSNDLFFISGLLPGDYNIRIKGVCCNGAESNIVYLNTTI